MLLIICFSSLLASTFASTSYYYPVPDITRYNTPILSKFSSSAVTPILEQYHTQDTLGQYSYGYSEPLSSKQEYRTIDGVTRGSYSYLDADSKVQTVDYIADADGFRVSATNLPRPVESAKLILPQPVTETPEVAAARLQHLAAHSEAQMRLTAAAAAAVAVPAAPKTKDASSASLNFPTSGKDLLPRPVEDTAEVAAAKKEFFKLYEEEKQRHQLLETKNQFAIPRPSIPSVSLQYYPIVTNRPAAAVHYKFASIPQRSYLPVAY